MIEQCAHVPLLALHYRLENLPETVADAAFPQKQTTCSKVKTGTTYILLDPLQEGGIFFNHQILDITEYILE